MTQQIEAPDALTDRQWAQGWGQQDGSKGEPFFPEQVGRWLQMDYAEGYAMAQPEHETCKWWLAREYRRLVAEEAEMNWRETIIHAGGRFIGASLEPAEVGA